MAGVSTEALQREVYTAPGRTGEEIAAAVWGRRNTSRPPPGVVATTIQLLWFRVPAIRAHRVRDENGKLVPGIRWVPNKYTDSRAYEEARKKHLT